MTPKEIIELADPNGSRYGIGLDAENGELLIEDHKQHTLIARSGAISQPLLEELVKAANTAHSLARTLEAIEAYCRAHAHQGCNTGTHQACSDVLRILEGGK